MCGLIGASAKPGARFGESPLRAALTRMTRRGPDGEGFWSEDAPRWATAASPSSISTRALDAEHLVCDRAEPGSGGTGHLLAPLGLLERPAALVPPPRVHRHRCCGVLAPMRCYARR